MDRITRVPVAANESNELATDMLEAIAEYADCNSDMIDKLVEYKKQLAAMFADSPSSRQGFNAAQALDLLNKLMSSIEYADRLGKSLQDRVERFRTY